MRISTKLIVAALIPALMALATAAGLLYSYRSIWSLEEKEISLYRISDELSELDSLVRSYVLHHEERPVRQFLNRHEETRKNMAAITFEDRRQRQLVENLANNTDTVKILFLKLVSNHERRGSKGDEWLKEEADQRLLGQLLIRSRAAKTDASRLVILISEDIIARQRRIYILVVALLAAAVVSCTMVLLAMMKKLTGSLERLRAGAGIVGGGNLDHRIGISSEDEIGALSSAFDLMSEKLKATTVSRDDLAVEVEERRKAEAALEAELVERKRAEDRASHLASFPELNPNPVMEVDLTGKITYFNPTAAKIIESIGRGKGDVDVFLPPDMDDILRRLERDSEATHYREVTVGERAFAATVSVAPGFGVARLYYLEITGRKRAEEALRESEQRMIRAQEIAHLGSWELDVVDNVLVWSDEVYRIFGFQPGEFAATYEAFLAAVHPDDRAAVDAAYTDSLLKGRNFYDIEHRVVRRSDGQIRMVHEKCEHFRDESGRVIRSVGMIHDITERKRDEFERRTTVDFLHLVSAGARTADLAREAASFLQQRSGCEAVGIRLREGGAYPYIENIGFSEDFVLAESRIFISEEAGRHVPYVDGTAVHACMCGSVIAGLFDPSKPFFTTQGSFWTNSTTELLAGAAEPDRRFRMRDRCNVEGYESVALIPLCIGEERLGLLQLNDRRKGLFSHELVALWERLAGYLAMAFTKLNAQEELHAAKEGLETRVAERTAELSTLAGRLQAELDSRLKAEEALRESEERFRSLLEHSPVGVCLVRGGRIVFMNPEQRRLFGSIPEEFDFREFSDIHPEDAEKYAKLAEAVSVGGSGTYETDLRFFPYGMSSEGTGMRWVHVRAIPMEYRGEDCVLLSMVDITGRKEMEHQYMAHEKLAALGQVAAGIAHEIRNPLSGINIYLSALEKVQEDPEVPGEERKDATHKIVKQLKSASARIEGVINKVLGFSRPKAPRLEPTDINLAAEEAIDFTTTNLRKVGITLDRSLMKDLPRCRADHQLIAQVLINLISNAAQAMENQESEKRIGISSASENGRLILCVSDSGPGVPPAMRNRIFDPFVTTRRDGYGIGLNLCRRIIKDHGGTISLGTSRWGGAEFRIELPVDAEPGPIRIETDDVGSKGPSGR